MSEFVKLGLNPDALSKCQMMSKLHIVDLLKSHKMELNSIAIVGSWYGQLAQVLHNANIGKHYTGVDIDPMLERPANHLNRNIEYYHIVGDMYDYAYNFYDTVINTSCEHISAPSEWLSILPSKTTVILQSNNFEQGDGHINCVNSMEQFAHQVSDYVNITLLSEIELPIYSRYTCIGTIK
jgi:hypothetical protein